MKKIAFAIVVCLVGFLAHAQDIKLMRTNFEVNTIPRFPYVTEQGIMFVNGNRSINVKLAFVPDKAGKLYPKYIQAKLTALFGDKSKSDTLVVFFADSSVVVLKNLYKDDEYHSFSYYDIPKAERNKFATLNLQKVAYAPQFGNRIELTPFRNSNVAYFVAASAYAAAVPDWKALPDEMKEIGIIHTEVMGYAASQLHEYVKPTVPWRKATPEEEKLFLPITEVEIKRGATDLKPAKGGYAILYKYIMEGDVRYRLSKNQLGFKINEGKNEGSSVIMIMSLATDEDDYPYIDSITIFPMLTRYKGEENFTYKLVKANGSILQLPATVTNGKRTYIVPDPAVDADQYLNVTGLILETPEGVKYQFTTENIFENFDMIVKAMRVAGGRLRN